MENITLQKAVEILNDRSTHNWVRQQAIELGKHDVVEAYYDALLLAQCAKARMDYVLRGV